MESHKFSLSERDRTKTQDQGSTIVEFAIVIPALAFVLFSFLQWGMIFAAHLTVRNAAEVAARFAAINDDFQALSQSDKESAVINIARNSVPSNIIDSSGIVLDSYLDNYSAGTATGAKKVDISYPLPVFVSWVVPGSSGGTYTIRASAVMW